MQTSAQKSHSAIVTLLLEGEGWSTRLSHVGPEAVVAKTPIELPPCEATLVITVDGTIERTRVRLPGGMTSSIEETPIQIIKP